MESRLTFRDKAGDVAWQKQLRDRYNDEGTPSVPHLSVKKAIVKQVTRRLAEQIILKYEWLGTMSNTTLHYGIFFGPYCAGVTCIAIATGTGGTGVYKMLRLKHQYQLATLARGACVHWAPKGTNSKLVSWTCRLLAQDSECKVIIAYADTDAGEIGTIYQACNWTYIGQGSSTTQYISPDGKRIFDQRNISRWAKRFGTTWQKQRNFLINQRGWTEQDTNPKHRYVFVLDKTDKKLTKLVERMREPYPKRS